MFSGDVIYKGLKTIILFLVIMFIINTAFGDKVTQNMALMILFSMLILNSDKAVKYFSSISDHLTADT